MGLIVPWYTLGMDLVLLLAIGYVVIFLYRRMGKYDPELNTLIKYSFGFLLLAVVGRLFDVIDDFCCGDTFYAVEWALYFVSILGVIYSVVHYIVLVERRYMPSIAAEVGSKPKVRVRGPPRESPLSMRAYVIFSKYRLADVIELLKSADYPIFALTRSPDLYEGFNKGHVETAWITQVPGGIPPTALHLLQDSIIQFVQRNPGSVVIIDSVEYLLLYNDFKTVFKFLVNVKDYLTAFNATLMVFVDDAVISPREKSFLLKEFEPL
ncbi:DUF835 domain-containing protein [Thermococcus indicus]|uniref:DUF835 domain-containing protein n=1 Tax=Thermococcus indicus TaxID=2586643 RepID=A0A4Y5SK25_9EURY|nr:DUF835 domain-containing protein [Thermococcus indicus]QDA30411.1 DUF835 domain-containing protein [Thermococcus indicus]